MQRYSFELNFYIGMKSKTIKKSIKKTPTLYWCFKIDCVIFYFATNSSKVFKTKGILFAVACFK
jgi:capsule polysaccharide export protein KpsE/RkpR